ncbi:MAG: MinD/ParA family protein [Pseudomonadales bacterium]
MKKAQKKSKTETRLPRVIAISSGKGGVGKSSIAVNLGISLAKTGAKVCLLDADTGLANANILLGLTPQFSLEHVLYGAKSIEEVMLDGPHGMKIIPGANGISECVTLHPRQQLRLTRELARIESEFNFMLIDTAAGISETTLDFVSAAHHTLVVITPEPTSLTDAFSLIKLLKRRRSTIHYHIVVNMCSSVGQAKEIYHRFCAAVEKYIGVQSHYLGYILRDESMRAAVMLQNPVAMFPKNDPSCRGFVKLADNLDAATNAVPVSGSFSAYWHRQYREQRSGQGQSADKESVTAAPDPSPSETRDSDYLSELRSRLLLLIEQGHAEEQLLQKLLQEGIEAFIKRYDKSPIDTLNLVEQLVLSPERDDYLMREIADRVKPWGGFSDTPPTNEPAKLSSPGSVDSGSTSQQSSLDPAASLKFGQQLESESTPSATPETKTPVPGNTSPMTEKVLGRDRARVFGIHHYDAARFGSQENLLDILKRQVNSDKSLSALLSTLA